MTAGQLLDGSRASGIGQLRLASAAMGTRFELVIVDDEPERWRPAGEEGIERIEECHRRYTRFSADSLLSHINREAARSAVRLDAETYALLQDALDVEHASRGAFSCAAVAARAAHSQGPTDANGAAAAHGPGFVLDTGARTIRFLRDDVQLDLGGIAKGHALDLAAAGLRVHGVTCALLHGGTSSVVAVGAPPGESGWRVALGREAGSRVVALRDRSLSVSAAGPRADHGRGACQHIVDPRTGLSVTRATLAAVIGPSCRLADAWATALAVLGERPATLTDEWMAFLQEPGR